MWALWSAAAWAQESGELRVCVDDQDELPIPGVLVTLRSTDVAGAARELPTDEDGCVTADLPAGSWSLDTERTGFSGLTVEGIQVVDGRMAQQKVVLQDCGYV